MIILGEKYTFTSLELERLQKKFETIDFVAYKARNPKIVISEIEILIYKSNKKLIVLNTLAVLPSQLLHRLTSLEEKHGVTYMTIESLLNTHLSKLYISQSKDDPQKENDFFPYSPWQYIQKRLIDISSVIILAPVSLPLFFYAVYRIKKESPGPVFFQQTRTGIYGKEFECIKFRSMYTEAELDGARFAQTDDPRAFKWGKQMRKSKLDELPQLWNVLKGEMHLIGPRPERPIWVREFEKSIPMYHKRHVVSPGITGWAQIKYHYGSGKIDARQKLMYDLYYIKNWNLFFDIKVIWKTALYLFTSKKDRLSDL